MHHAGTKRCRPRQANQVNMAHATSNKAHSCGSGTVGTVAWGVWLTGVSRLSSYCCWVSSTTAPLTGVTR